MAFFTCRYARGRGIRRAVHGLPCLPLAVGRPAPVQIIKRNFSDLKNRARLEEVCSKEVKIISLSTPKSKEFSKSKEDLKGMLFENEDSLAKARDAWLELFGSEETPSKFPTKSPILQDMVSDIRNNPEVALFKNGAVKKLLCDLMRLGSEDYDGTYYTRMSTTTDATSDRCALQCSTSLMIKEDALYGKHSMHVIHSIILLGGHQKG